mmetsp:Transcript_42887/g.41229  ORF Transcript_42887/g.41229 Transcript_42887/m.41229 type:complete len:174 (+) Transcript_42887:342-863(+)
MKQLWAVSIVFVILTYCLGAFFFMLPSLIYSWLAQESSICFASPEMKQSVTLYTLLLVPVVSLTFLVAFRVAQRGKIRAPQHLWFQIKCNNWWVNFIFAGAMVVYEFPAALITAVFIYPYLHNAIYAGSSKMDLAISILSMVFIATISFFFLFGTLLADEEGQGFLNTIVYLL